MSKVFEFLPTISLFKQIALDRFHSILLNQMLEKISGGYIVVFGMLMVNLSLPWLRT